MFLLHPQVNSFEPAWQYHTTFSNIVRYLDVCSRMQSRCFLQVFSPLPDSITKIQISQTGNNCFRGRTWPATPIPFGHSVRTALGLSCTGASSNGVSPSQRGLLWLDLASHPLPLMDTSYGQHSGCPSIGLSCALRRIPVMNKHKGQSLST